MTLAQIAEAQALARDWKPKTGKWARPFVDVNLPQGRFGFEVAFGLGARV
jgi:hypothetical protein